MQRRKRSSRDPAYATFPQLVLLRDASLHEVLPSITAGKTEKHHHPLDSPNGYLKDI
jgi:hypothetical protein